MDINKIDVGGTIIDNTEYNKYGKAVVKLLDCSLKEGEFFLFTKRKEESFGIIISEERLNVTPVSVNNKMSRILEILKEPKGDWFTGKVDNYILNKK